jgi:hypothetical protein
MKGGKDRVKEGGGVVLMKNGIIEVKSFCGISYCRNSGGDSILSAVVDSIDSKLSILFITEIATPCSKGYLLVV